MKDIFKSNRFKLVAGIIALLLVGALIAAANGRGETAQSSVIGTVFAPCHFVAQKISNTIDRISKNASGNAVYEKEIASLNDEIGELRSQLADYENLKMQNELYKEFLDLKEENKDYKFVETSIIGRDSADIYKSFTISKGLVSGIKKGNAVLYGKYIVGVVDKVYPDYSVVKTVLDSKFNISAYEILTNEISYVTGNAKLAKNGKCKMANLASSTDISYGSIVCTAGISSTVPKGLIIGTVDEISDEATDISSYAVITPGVDIDEITSCFVLTDFGK
ncbi:MAG: rod shape-determining protein MreC [Eubacterium sp.]|nr:rod shape-determining protein MreC [Eubacterium sp.]MBR4241013.1 rod shape-determining protein MreC [Eubacterium sp.]MBR7061162.1 rod shape-determining protein MreC [Eubacterium sp.]